MTVFERISRTFSFNPPTTLFNQLSRKQGVRLVSISFGSLNIGYRCLYSAQLANLYVRCSFVAKNKKKLSHDEHAGDARWMIDSSVFHEKRLSPVACK